MPLVQQTSRLRRLGTLLCRTPVIPLCLLAAPAASQTVGSLLVELRQAPTHEVVAQAGAQKSALGAQEDQRWHAIEQQVRALAAPNSSNAQKSTVVSALKRDPVGSRAQRLQLDSPLSLAQAEALVAQLRQRPDVAWAAVNQRERRSQVANAPSDTRFPGPQGQWWLQPVQGSNSGDAASRMRGVAGFQSAWASVTTGSATPVVVAVLDGGVTDHPELAGRVLPGFDLVSDIAHANDGDGRDADASDPGDWVSATDRSSDAARFGGCDIEDSTWHGTAIAGQIAAQTNNSAGVAGMHWGAKVLPVRVSGKCGAELSDILDGMRWAVGLSVCKSSDSRGQCLQFAPINPSPARIVNVSFGGTGSCDPYLPVIDELRARGALVVASAGNRSGEVSRPAKCAGVVGVAALNRDGFKSVYSSFGAELSATGLATVGGDDSSGNWAAVADDGVLSLANTGLDRPGTAGYARHFGTSFAAPIVAGAAALMLSVNSQLTVDQLQDSLRKTARPHVTSGVPGVTECKGTPSGRCLCTPQSCGAGILDVTQALVYAQSPGSYTPPVWSKVWIDTTELRAAAARGPDLEPKASAIPAAPPLEGSGSSSAGFVLLMCLAAWLLPRRGR